MNSSSIIFAFFIAGFLSVIVHDVIYGPVAYGPNNALHQVAKSYPKRHNATSQNEHSAMFQQSVPNHKN